MKNNFQSKAVPRGTRTIWRYLGALFLLFTFAVGNVWAADPDLAVTFDGATYADYVKDYSAKGIKLTFYANGNDAAVEQTAFKGNLSGHYYEDIAKSSTAYNHGSMLIEASTAIDSISLFWVPNTTSKNTYLGVVGWNARAATSDSYSNTVDSLFVTTAYNISTKNYEAAKWETLDLSHSSLKALAFSRKFPKNVFTYKGALYASNFGGEQTVLVLGVKVWLHPASTGPVDPTASFSNGNYTIGGSDLDLSSLFTTNSDGAVTYTITDQGTTDAALRADGKSFYATVAGSAIVKVEQASTSSYNAYDATATITVAACETSISGQPSNASLKVGDANPTLSVTATNVAAYAWKESSDGTSYDGSSTLSTSDSYTPSVNDAVQTKYYYCEVTSSCSGSAVVKSNIVTVEVEAADPPCAELVPATSGDAPAAGDAISLTTATGGSIKALTANLSYDANGLLFGNNSSTKAEVTLTHLMQVGTVITATIYNASDNKARGLKLLNNSGTSKATWTKTMIGDHVETYTVVAGDGLAGSNVFQLQRSENAYLKDLKVSNCGAELLALSSAVSVAGKATVTLSKSLVAAGGTATATYSAIDPAYDFDEWVVSGATIDDAKANPVTITMGSTDATITLKLKAASVKHTVTYYDGEDELGSELVEEGSNPTGAGLAPTKRGYTFGGWSLTNGGDAIASYASVTVDADLPLYAVWNAVVCPISGVVFSIVADPSKAPDSDYKIAGNTRADLATYATITRGAAVFGNADGNQYITIKSSTSAITLSGSNARGYVKATMDCDLEEGDIIRIADNTNKFRLAFDSTATDKVDVTSGNHDVEIDADHAGKYEFFIYRNGNDVTFSDVRVIRPAKYAVTYTAGTGSVKDGESMPTQEATVEGGKFNIATGDALEKSGYDFTGWQWTDDESATHDVTAGDEFTMPGYDVEFVAQWTLHVAKYGVKFMDGTTKLDSLSVSVGSAPVFANPTKALYNFAGWKDGDDNDVTLSDLATSVTVEDTELVLYAQWTKVYASSLDFVALAASAPDILETCAAANISLTKGSNSGWDNGGTAIYNGYKLKDATTNVVSFNLQQGKRASITMGYVETSVSVTVNGEAKDFTTSKTENSTFVWNASYEDALIVLTNNCANNKTAALRAITIEDIPAVSDDATLSDLQVGGETVSGFAAATLDYYYELDYGETSYPAVTYTKHDDAASVVYQDASERTDDCSIVKVTAEDGETINQYIIHFYYAPKYGVELIKATHTGATTADVTGYIGGAVDKLTQPGGKLGSDDPHHYFGIQLASGNFQAGDMLVIKASALNGGNAVTLYSDKGETAISTDGSFDATTKMYTYTLTAETEKIYLYRQTSACNANVEYMAVYRYMAPFIESFEVAGVAGTISGTAISVEVPNATDVTALTPTIQYWGNGGGAITPTGTQNFTDPVAYTVSSAYAEDATGAYAPVTYTVTVTKAAAIDHVDISGTLTVMEDNTTTLTATVIDTNDAEAANQNVTWTSDAEGVATVADGVVTGVAAGTAHITATSVEDGTISATVEVTVTENLCRTWSNPASKETGATIGKMVVTPENIGTLQSNMTPYSGATATNAWKLDSKDSRYAEIKFTDNAQFESLTLGVSSNGSNKNYSFAVVCSSAAGDGFAAGVLSAATYEAVDTNEDENLVDVELPTGTKVVRVYRQYTYGSSTVGGGSSVFLYYINACKKELVALTAVAVADKSLAVGVSGAPSVTLTPANADVASYAWEIVSDETGEATINATTGAVSSASIGAVTVKVTATDELSNVIVSNIATINIVNKYEAVVPVTATTTWSWDALDLTGYTTDGPTIAAPDTVLANYFSGEEWQQIAGGVGGRPYRNTSNYKCFQGYTLYFETTVPGIVTLYAGRISDDQVVSVNGHAVGTVSSGKAYLSKIAVPAGKVYITSGSNGMRIYSMTFDTDLASYDVTDNVLDGYTRSVTEGRYGTICLPNGGVMVGAELFEIAYYGETSHKIFLDNIPSGEMEAGVPYIFLPNEGADKLAVFYTDEANESAKSANGLIGYIGASEDPLDAAPIPHNAGYYILNNNQYREVVYENSAYVLSHRAYIKLAAINPTEPALAPGRRRVALGVQSEQVATGCENLNVSDKPVKMIIDGQLFIIRGEKMYDAKGQLVK